MLSLYTILLQIHIQQSSSIYGVIHIKWGKNRFECVQVFICWWEWWVLCIDIFLLMIIINTIISACIYLFRLPTDNCIYLQITPKRVFINEFTLFFFFFQLKFCSTLLLEHEKFIFFCFEISHVDFCYVNNVHVNLGKY